MKLTPFWETAGEIRSTIQSRLSPRRVFHWHCHSFYELALVLSGECDWRIGPRSGPRAHRTLLAGDVLLLSPGAWHGEFIRPERHALVAWIGFSSAALPPRWTGRPIHLEDDTDEVVRAFHAVYREHSRSENADRIRLLLQSLLLLTARQAEKAPAPIPPRGMKKGSRLNPRQISRMEAAAHTLRHNLNPPLEIGQVATLHSLSPAHFSTLFRRHFGVAPRTFLRRSRVEKAEELLLGSDLALKEIATEAGFTDAAHFCKAFRALRGMTPRTFQAAHVP